MRCRSVRTERATRRVVVPALLLAVLATLVAMAAVPTRACAADAKVARALSEEGDRLFQVGKFQAAADAYERAYAQDPRPAFLHNIALSHRRQHEIDGKVEHLRKAREVYRNYLRLEPGTARRPAVEAIIEELTARIDKEEKEERRAADEAPAPPAVQPAPPNLALRTPPPGTAAAVNPGVSASATPAGVHATDERPSRLPWILGGLALAATAAVVVVFLARPERQELDGPTIDLSGMRR